MNTDSEYFCELEAKFLIFLTDSIGGVFGKNQNVILHSIILGVIIVGTVIILSILEVGCANRCLKESEYIMQFHKWRNFKLELHYIWISIIGSSFEKIFFPITYIFDATYVTYTYVANAHFYLVISGRQVVYNNQHLYNQEYIGGVSEL